jgi:hypothetical protein
VPSRLCEEICPAHRAWGCYVPSAMFIESWKRSQVTWAMRWGTTSALCLTAIHRGLQSMIYWHWSLIVYVFQSRPFADFEETEVFRMEFCTNPQTSRKRSTVNGKPKYAFSPQIKIRRLLLSYVRRFRRGGCRINPLSCHEPTCLRLSSAFLLCWWLPWCSQFSWPALNLRNWRKVGTYLTAGVATSHQF